MCPEGNTNPARKRRAHKKSRNGCANCKIRGIKCSEEKPSCKKCESFNVICSYGSKFSSDNLAAKASFRVHLGQTVKEPPVSSLPAPLPIAGSKHRISESYQLVPRDIRLIEKFQRRTVWTLGTAATHHAYATTALRLAFNSPLLMHTILALTETHDQSLSSSSRMTTCLSYHWYRAVSLMHRHLAQSILPSERDSLWLSSSLISIANIAYLEARYPEEAWPLRPDCDADLAWFKLCEGQKLIAQLTEPTRPESQVRLAAQEMHDTITFVTGLGRPTTTSACTETGGGEEVVDEDWNNNVFQGLPKGFKEFFDLDSDSPYYAAVKTAAELFRLDLDEENLLVHICFAGALNGRFRNLLHSKDEKAMLLLLYWYAKICDRRAWWLWKQSYIEGLGVCKYLEDSWMRSGNQIGLELLEAPRARLMAAVWGK
ncbi:hypothetical protein F5Y16DRAFT_269664 [Xylariaceae sp. FL0255]|nr:hypothetical protein F5Y16DRAFT_269664 [Xylariaceae sp. FL0255]